ncbi:putative carboxylesterase 8 [Iris pallida]|uniref:Carboxylesterase 8 n=1 Tax=Iris pallida TaxID=29817 RepID=A0AAX6EE35_IRIPA|nr:putative carboxylesterase 8 [Iris pallida]
MEKGATTATTRSDAPKSESIFLQIVEHPDGSVTRPVVPLAPPSQEAPKPPPSSPRTSCSTRPRAPGSASTSPAAPRGGQAPGAALPPRRRLRALQPGLPPLQRLLRARRRRAPRARGLPPLPPVPGAPPPPRLRRRGGRAAVAAAGGGPPGAADPWVASHGDLSRCFLAGSSSGGNIAYHAGLRMRAAGQQLKVAGLVMIQPYFGGEERTGSEARSGEDPVLPLRASDMMWRMALPAGATRDHEYCNPTAAKAVGGGAAPALPRCLVTGCKGDPLFDRQEAFAEMLEKAGAAEELVVRFDHEGYHAIELFEPASADKLLAEVREFVYGSASK